MLVQTLENRAGGQSFRGGREVLQVQRGKGEGHRQGDEEGGKANSKRCETRQATAPKTCSRFRSHRAVPGEAL